MILFWIGIPSPNDEIRVSRASESLGDGIKAEPNLADTPKFSDNGTRYSPPNRSCETIVYSLLIILFSTFS